MESFLSQIYEAHFILKDPGVILSAYFRKKGQCFYPQGPKIGLESDLRETAEVQKEYKEAALSKCKWEEFSPRTAQGRAWDQEDDGQY